MSRTSYGYSDYPRSHEGFAVGFYSYPVTPKPKPVKTIQETLLENVKALIGNYAPPRATNAQIMEMALEEGLITNLEFSSYVW